MGTVSSGRHGSGDKEGVALMLDDAGSDAHDASSDYVAFVSAGEHVKGEFHCSECGYGVTVYRELPVCPMCGNGSWEQSTWSPFTRSAAHFARELH